MANLLTQTTLSAALLPSANVLNVASASNLSAPTNNFYQKIYVVNPNSRRGELMNVLSISGTAITVSRLDKFKQSFLSGSIVLIAPVSALLGGFQEFDPVGVATPPMPAAAYSPWLNVDNGNQWLYSAVTGQWVPGWNTAGPYAPTTAVASAAGAILPTGPLFHVTGTAAVTGFTIPVGFAGGSFTIIPDGNFTWTTAGNIGLAGTAVTGRALTFTWDSNAGKFYPSYV